MSNFDYTFDWTVVVNHAPELLASIGRTLFITIESIVLSLILGAILGALKAYGQNWLKRIIDIYVSIFRYTPILVQLFFIYYALPSVGVTLNILQVALMSLVLWGGAYNSENFRSAFEAVSDNVRESAVALGMGSLPKFRYVELPLAIRIVLPASINTSISILKNTAYLSAIGFAELTYVATNIIASNFRVFEMFTVLAVVYLGLVFGLSALMNAFQKRTTRYEGVKA